ncbi:MAG: hypothetical protein ACOX4W_03365 [Bacilli bacterium]
MKRLLIVLLFLSLTGCKTKTPTKKESFENDYVSFKKTEHVFQKEDLNDVLEILIKESGIIVFAFNPNVRSCPYCDEALPIINEVAKELKIDKVIYVDIYADRTNNSYQYQLLYNYLTNLNNPNVKEEIALELIDNTKIIVPDVYVVKDGEVLAHHIALLKNEENQYIRNLNDVQKEEVYNIYYEMFSLLFE